MFFKNMFFKNMNRAAAVGKKTEKKEKGEKPEKLQLSYNIQTKIIKI